MRELKFRVWDKRSKVMFPITSFSLEGKSPEVWADYEVIIEVYGYTDDDEHDEPTYLEARGWDTYEDTWSLYSDLIEIMQYTGLKDKNGQEIYEGDIVQHLEKVYTIQYMRGGFYGVWEKDAERSEIWGDDFGYSKIVGNIYEHPKLLGAKQ